MRNKGRIPIPHADDDSDSPLTATEAFANKSHAESPFWTFRWSSLQKAL
jgi:hypothetical protein